MIASHIALAKTTRPGCAGVVPRMRLFDRLTQACQKPAVWIAGPPGAGKTMLVASYLEATRGDSLWYQLDESDNDAASFFYHLGIAVDAHVPRRRHTKLPQYAPEHQSSIGAFARRYFQSLFQRFGEGLVFVFDGYHELSAQSAMHEVLSIALTEVPPGATVILISRTDPPSAMARLRANRRLEVIGWRDLRLTREESAAIAMQRAEAMPRERLDNLFERTQGWAAGLILLLEHSSDPSWSAPSDLPTPQLLFDYLAGEFFDGADAVTREVLLTTASLPRMTAQMAATLSGHEDAGARLEQLYRSNHFVALKQSAPEAVFEYHPLLREFVLSRANEALSRERRQALQRTAAMLLQSQGLLAEAVDLARANGDHDRIADIVRHHARQLLDSGRSETLAQWVESLPKSYQEEHPWMLYWIGVARTYSSPREGRRAHERAYALFEAQAVPDKLGLLFACSGAMDAILYELDDFSLLDRWIEIMGPMLRSNENLVSGPLEARIACSLLTSMVLRQPHHPEIEYWAERAYRTSVAHSDVSARASVEPRIALGIVYAGHFPKAWMIIEGVREIVRRHDVSPHARVMLFLVEASYFMLKGQRDECYAAVRAGLELERNEGVDVFTRQLLEYGAGGALTAGDEDSAASYLHELDQLPGVPARFDSCLQHLFSAWLAMRRNDDVLAYQAQKLALRAAIDVGCPVFEAVCRIASAQVHYSVGEPRPAWLQLQQVYDIARRIQNRLLEYTGLLCYAHIALDSGRRPRSGMRALRLALSLGKPRNLLSFPLWQPRMLSQLCSIALEYGIETAFVHRLIDERELKLDSSKSGLLDWPWPIRVRTLGRFELVRNGETVNFTGKAQRRPLDLLKLIVACGGRDVSEARISEVLWPRVDGDSAHRSFTTTLHRLRKLLDIDGAIQLSGGKVSIDGRLVWVDTWAFEQLCSRASQLLRGQALELRAGGEDWSSLSEKVRTLYAGPFLESETEDGWILSMRERLRQRFARLVVDMARSGAADATGRTIDLIEYAVEADPASEPLWRCLIEAYDAAGRRAEALATYNRCRVMLAQHLQAEPSTETSALHQRIAQRG